MRWSVDIQVNTSRPDRYAPVCLYDQDTGTLFITNGFSYGPWVADPLNMERYNAVHVYLPECRTYVTVLLSDFPGVVVIYAPNCYYRWQYHHSLTPQALKIYSSSHTATTRSIVEDLTTSVLLLNYRNVIESWET